MRLKLFTLIASIAFSSSAIANSNLKYYEEGDDFSNEVVSVLQVRTTDTSPAALFLSCNPDSGLSVQLVTRSVMFPDDLEGNRMRLSTTHKFEEAAEAATSYWLMAMMEYDSSWYAGDERKFMEQVASSSQLNLRLNKRNTIYRFMIEDADEYITKILSRC